MGQQPPDRTLSQEERKEIFLALVEAQDSDMTIATSRQAVAKRFGIDERQVRQIEREGLDGNWPPLE
jgi:crotonobetainyl-CoA:carnitine CoA-transferase CaiB-like acyl-CoA transferase